MKVSGFTAFTLERYFAEYEFSGADLLCCSDCEPLSMTELVAMADDECKSLWENLVLGYTESNGLPLLRQEIAKMYNEDKVGNTSQKIEPEKMMIVCPEEGIYLSMRSLLEKGDEVIVPVPCYQSLCSVAEAMDCKVVPWNMFDSKSYQESGFLAQDLEKLITPQTKALVVNFPHNPSGYLPTNKEWKEIIDICRKNDIYLFSDEMYHGLEYNEDAKINSAVLEYEKAISLSGVSKSLSLPGLRIGWIICHDTDFLERFQLLRDYTTICPPAPSEILSLIAVRERKKIIKRNLDIIQEGLTATVALIEKYPEIFELKVPVAGSICFPRLRQGSAESFCRKLVETDKIMLLPSCVYGLDESVNCFRLGFGRKNAKEILAKLDKVLGNYFKKC